MISALIWETINWRTFASRLPALVSKGPVVSQRNHLFMGPVGTIVTTWTRYCNY